MITGLFLMFWIMLGVALILHGQQRIEKQLKAILMVLVVKQTPTEMAHILLQPGMMYSVSDYACAKLKKLLDDFNAKEYRWK